MKKLYRNLLPAAVALVIGARADLLGASGIHRKVMVRSLGKAIGSGILSVVSYMRDSGGYDRFDSGDVEPESIGHRIMRNMFYSGASRGTPVGAISGATSKLKSEAAPEIAPRTTYEIPGEAFDAASGIVDENTKNMIGRTLSRVVPDTTDIMVSKLYAETPSVIDNYWAIRKLARTIVSEVASILITNRVPQATSETTSRVEIYVTAYETINEMVEWEEGDEGGIAELSEILGISKEKVSAVASKVAEQLLSGKILKKPESEKVSDTPEAKVTEGGSAFGKVMGGLAAEVVARGTFILAANLVPDARNTRFGHRLDRWMGNGTAGKFDDIAIRGAIPSAVSTFATLATARLLGHSVLTLAEFGGEILGGAIEGAAYNAIGSFLPDPDHFDPLEDDPKYPVWAGVKSIAYRFGRGVACGGGAYLVRGGVTFVLARGFKFTKFLLAKTVLRGRLRL
ncbi:MAG: hypothetical protein LBU15_03070 [Rickettsiales bacterium]|jgi:hypothetical protein|nr:hypothetical protein [Rickettsiales bacterium]